MAPVQSPRTGLGGESTGSGARPGLEVTQGKPTGSRRSPWSRNRRTGSSGRWTLEWRPAAHLARRDLAAMDRAKEADELQWRGRRGQADDLLDAEAVALEHGRSSAGLMNWCQSWRWRGMNLVGRQSWRSLIITSRLGRVRLIVSKT